jgi:fatty-acyl-CoA synthase
VIVPKPGKTPCKDEMLAFMTGKIAKWWLPDDVVLVDAIPHTATGKIQKTALREMFRGHRLPGAQ